MRLVVILGLLLAVTACERGTASALAPTPLAEPPHTAMPRAKVVLVAAEGSIKAFDNAVARFAKDLTNRAGIAATDIQRFSANPSPDSMLSDVDAVMRVIGTLQAAPGQACLVFMTGHGMRNNGIVFPRSKDYLDAKQLDRVLTLGCGAQPTVVIMSACYSGLYANRRVARDNRIIITATNRDRPSFGCGAQNEFTFFDGCFLTAFEDPRGRTWEDVAAMAMACVADLERADDYVPSRPLLMVGKSVAGLPVPTAR